MAKKTKKDTNWTWIIVSLIIGGAILGAGFINYKLKMKTIEINYRIEQAEKKDLETKLSNCYEGAQEIYLSSWNSACNLIGKNDKCSLPSDRADRLEEMKKDEIDRCIKLYGD